MAYYDKNVIRHQTFGLTICAGGPLYGMRQLEKLGIRGTIRRVCGRAETATTGTGSLDVWILDGARSPIVSPTFPPPPKDEDIFYSNIGTVITPSATTAMINDHVAATGGSVYEVDPTAAPTTAVPNPQADLKFAWSYTPTVANDVVLSITVWSEVQL